MLIARLFIFDGMSGLMSTIVLFLLFFPSFVFGVKYNIVDSVVGKDFYDFFAWQTLQDPTHGRVQYVDEDTSKRLNLTFASENAFILRADHKEVLNPSGPGRKSVRIQSKKKFIKHVAVFDIRHMPEGCGTWPAVWEVAGPRWPIGGEIDILEGVNDQSPNAATLHTTEGCTIPRSRGDTGNPASLNCAAGESHQGCSIRFSSENSYGPNFNRQGGGWYAIERTTDFLKVYFWSRNDPDVPSDVKTGASTINTNSWGNPSAHFPGTSCNLKKYLEAHYIIINLTLCGGWAGDAYPQSCPLTCEDFVNKSPEKFSRAYFNFASIRTYQ